MKVTDIEEGKQYVVGKSKWLNIGEVITVLHISRSAPQNDTNLIIKCQDSDKRLWWISPKEIEKPYIRNQLNILVCGFGKSGKDTAAEYWRDNFGMTFMSSSWAAGEIFIFNLLMKKYDYASKEECFADRRNRRDEWYDLICWYNKDDKTRLAREILSKTGAYIGMRDRPEVLECKKQNVSDIIIWIDAEERVGKESEDSCTVTKEDADIIITNNGTEAEFKEKLNKVGKIIFKKLV
ncbi:MAG: hypothetical protein KA234_00560 [Saprospiraceae bacterium]|nr:hypothetical protein [Saprospiraceae bacterium]